MEFKKEKCSSKSHKEIEASSYCIICKVYMCHKCETFHSDLCGHHKIINSSDLDITEFYTGICKENNHLCELDYFCRSHNILVCAKCIVKIQDENNGKHCNCKICTINEIKNEKMNNINDNINILQKLSNNIQESVDNLKKLYENINEKKEQLKMKAIKLFTKIRNEINNKEDKLLSEIDDFFENNFIKEEIIKNSEKLPNRIKVSLEKSKILNDNKENDINAIINTCLLIENNIKDVKTINDFISKSNTIYFIFFNEIIITFINQKKKNLKINVI